MIVLILVILITLGCSNQNSTSTNSESISSSQEDKSTQKVVQKNITKLEKFKEEVIEAKGNYDQISDKLINTYSKHPRWEISGEIVERNSGQISLWGKANSDDAKSNHPGWLRDDGNILITNPNQNKISYKQYKGGVHWYIKQEYGTNAFGAKVPVNIYGPPPKTIVKQRKKQEQALEKIHDKLNNLVTYIDKKYKSEVNSNTKDALIYEEYGRLYHDLYKDLNKYLNNNILAEYNLINEALSNYEQALKLNPKNVSILLILADLNNTYYSDGRDYAKKYYRKIVKLNPDALLDESLNSLVEAYDAGLILMEEDLYNKAVVSLKKAKKYSDHPTIKMQLIYALDKQIKELPEKGSEDKLISLSNDIIKEYSALRKQDALSDKGFKNLSELAEDSGKLRILEVEIYHNLASLYESKNDLDTAINYRNKSISLWDDMFEYVATGLYDLNDNATELLRNSVNDSIKLANIYSKKRNWENTIKQLTRAIDISLNASTEKLEMDSQNPYLHYLFGRVYYKYSQNLRGNSKTEAILQQYAFEEIKKALKIEPDNKIYNNTLGYMYLSQHTEYENRDKEQAKLYLKKAIASDPNYKKAYGNLARVIDDRKKQREYRKISKMTGGIEDIDEILTKYAPQKNKFNCSYTSFSPKETAR